MKFRIVKDDYEGYEVQVKVYWFSAWHQISSIPQYVFGANTNSSIEKAEQLAKDWYRDRKNEHRVIKEFEIND